MRCKTIEEYRKAISEAISVGYGSETAYCEQSGVSYSTLRKFLRGDYNSLTKATMRLIELDLDVSMSTPKEAPFSLENGGLGLNLYMNSIPNHLIAQFDWNRLYKIAKANKDKGVCKALVKLNTPIEVEEFNCAATLYLNANKEGNK